MPSKNILHNDIRIFKSKPDGPVVEVSNTAMTFPALERRTVPSKAPLANNISIHLHEFLKQQGFTFGVITEDWLHLLSFIATICNVRSVYLMLKSNNFCEESPVTEKP